MAGDKDGEGLVWWIVENLPSVPVTYLVLQLTRKDMMYLLPIVEEKDIEEELNSEVVWGKNF